MELLPKCADNLSSYQREMGISKEADFFRSLLHNKTKLFSWYLYSRENWRGIAKR